jgi:outer membrane protein insertion porin family
MFQKYRHANHFLFILIAIILLASCTVVKSYPKNKPFVFKNKITVVGPVSKDEKKRLQTELVNYWDDSVRVKTITQFGIKTVIKDPNVFDSAGVVRSIGFMNSYLNSQGYYNPVLKDTFYIDTVKAQMRTTVEMNINVNKNLKIDSVAYALSNTDLQELALKNQQESLLEKNKNFTNQLISGELDRLTNLFRANGYFKLTRDNLYAEVDTTDLSLLEVTLDPFEQARRIAEATAKRLENPTINVFIKQRATNDTNAFKKYYTGKIFYYPDTRNLDVPDSLINHQFPIVYTQREFTTKQTEALIHFRPLREHTYLKEGTLYNDKNYFKTVNAFTQLGAWSQVDVRTVTSGDSINKVDFHFFLTPAIVNGNLLGVANVLTLRNRNVWKESVQSSTNLRNGIELGFTDTGSLLQTFQSTLSQTYSIPRFITPFRITGVKKLDDYKTVVNLNGSYTDRRKFFRLRSLVASWGYEWKKNKHLWIYRPLNIELYALDTLEGLRSAFIENPFLRTAFNTGYVISQTLTYNITWPSLKRPNVSNYFRISTEEAGALAGRFRSFGDKIYQYIKAESEFRRTVQIRKTSIAYRLFGGIGYNYSNDPIIGQSLPFFKQFVAGGPNSMRAWPLRQLGLGSSVRSDTIAFRDRYGDIQLEGNVEYRFPLATISTVKINSAIFADMGNIWNLKNPIANPDTKLTFNRFARDIAVAAGTGLRFDFNYFLIRIDFAYKVKDPTRKANYGWMSIKDFEWRNKEYEIYINNKLLKRNNYAVQLGIGLPF